MWTQIKMNIAETRANFKTTFLKICSKLFSHSNIFNDTVCLNILLQTSEVIIHHIIVGIMLNYGHATFFCKNGRMSG